MSKSTVRMFRIAGYAIVTILTISFFRNISTVSSWILWLQPIFVWWGMMLMRFKEKSYPFSRAENIIVKTVSFTFLAICLAILVYFIATL